MNNASVSTRNEYTFRHPVDTNPMKWRHVCLAFLPTDIVLQVSKSWIKINVISIIPGSMFSYKG